MNGEDGSFSVESLLSFGLTELRAQYLVEPIGNALEASDPLAAWSGLSREHLAPEDPIELHRALHAAVMSGWDDAKGPAPVWAPTKEEVAASRAGRVMGGDFRAFHRRSIDEPEAHYADMLKWLNIHFDTKPSAMVDLKEGVTKPRWLPGARLNIAASCFEGRDSASPAIVHGAVGRPPETITLGQLEERVAVVVDALGKAGFKPGDTLAIAMPMTVESVVLYLAIVAFGGAVISIADSFAGPEIATRLRIAQAKAIFTQDVIHRGGKTLPLYERVLDAEAQQAIVIAAGDELAVPLREGDRAYDAFVAAAAPQPLRYHASEPSAATNILFSSGTTGEPKAIVWDHVTPIKAAADGFVHHDIRPRDVVAWPTNLGWMMGPWLIYASLLNGAAIALFDGLPSGRDFGLFVQDARVNMLGVVPSLVKAWRASDCMRGLDWSAIRAYSSTGEASNPLEMHWLMARAGYKPVVEYCGGTEIGGGYVTGSVVQPQTPSCFSTPAIGCSFLLIDDQGVETDMGEVALIPPMLGSSSTLLNRDHHEVYFKDMPQGPDGQRLRRHGDQMQHLGGGYFRAHGRVDDTMNLGGIKTSSAEIERACATVSGVVETAAIAVTPLGGGPDRLVVCVVHESPLDADTEQLKKAFSTAIRSRLNPLFKVHDVTLVEALPRTASNKVMRRVLRAQYKQ